MKKLLYSEILDIKQIDGPLSSQLFKIYQCYFENVKFTTFREHIGHKDNIIILRDRSGHEIQGFSTLKVINKIINNENSYAIFSGDTIIHKAYWSEQELVRRFCQFAGQFSSRLKKNEKLYWLLISKGYKTYRYLPVFINNFYPNYKSQIPKDFKDIMDKYYADLYPNEYNPKTNLLTFNKNIGNLKRGVGDATPLRKLDPNINFFAKNNPDHMQGVELTCIAELTEDNLKSIARKHFLKGKEIQKCI